MTIEWGTSKFDNGSNEQVLSGQERATFFHIMLPALAIFFVIGASKILEPFKFFINLKTSAFVFYFVHGFTTYDRVRNIRFVDLLVDERVYLDQSEYSQPNSAPDNS